MSDAEQPVFRVLSLHHPEAVFRAWLELNRDDIIDMRLADAVVEFLLKEERPPLGTDWHPWLERTVARLMQKF